MFVFYLKNKVRNLGSYFQSEKFFPWSSHNCYTPASYSGYGFSIEGLSVRFVVDEVALA